MVGVLPVKICIDLNHSCSNYEGRSFVYGSKGRELVHGKEAQRLSSLVNARQKKESLIHDAMMKCLRLLGAYAVRKS